MIVRIGLVLAIIFVLIAALLNHSPLS